MEPAVAKTFLAPALLSAALLSGCKSYLEPYVPLDPPTGALPTQTAMPNVERAVQSLDLWRTDAESKHNDLTKTTRQYNVATFGLAAGAGIAPVYNAYKDLISALAIGAGTAYTANTLFFPTDQASLYSAAHVAFTCLRNKGQSVLSAMSPDKSLAAFDATYSNLLSSVSSCQGQPGQVKLEEAYKSARDSFERASAADYGAGEQLREAGRNIASSLNQELDKRAASPAAILAAAKGVSAFNVPPGSTASAAANNARALLVGIRGPPCSPADQDRMAAQTKAYLDRKSKIDNALDGLSQLESVCTVNAPSVADLAISQDSVTLVPGAFVNVVVTGGRAPYVVIWEGTDPSGNGIDAAFVPPNTVRLSASSKLTTAASYTLDVQDSSLSGRLKKIAVTAKPAP